MISLTTSIAVLIAGLIFLVLSADRFIDAARCIAVRMGISPLIIGVTIVGFGTSAPEMIVSAMAAWQNSPGIAVGNALGSNIANIALILGITALISPIHSSREVTFREYPIMLGVTLFAGLVMLNGRLDRWEGVLFFLLQTLLLWVSVRISRRQRGGLPTPSSSESDHTTATGVATATAATTTDTIAATTSDATAATTTDTIAATSDATSDEKAKTSPPPLVLEWLRVFGYLCILMISSRALVWGAANLAERAGISDLIIGLTIIAVGTSLPELAASLAASRKGLSDMVLGNVLGSNGFNLLSVLGISAVVRPQLLDRAVLTRDLPVMVGVTLLLGVFLIKKSPHGLIHRGKGLILLTTYAGYQALLYFAVVNPA